MHYNCSRKWIWLINFTTLVNDFNGHIVIYKRTDKWQGMSSIQINSDSCAKIMIVIWGFYACSKYISIVTTSWPLNNHFASVSIDNSGCDIWLTFTYLQKEFYKNVCIYNKYIHTSINLKKYWLLYCQCSWTCDSKHTLSISH